MVLHQPRIGDHRNLERGEQVMSVEVREVVEQYEVKIVNVIDVEGPLPMAITLEHMALTGVLTWRLG